MGLFDFLLPKKKGIDSHLFETDNYQNEINAFASRLYIISSRNFNIIRKELKRKGLNDVQCNTVIHNLRKAYASNEAAAKTDFSKSEISDIKIHPSPDHKKGEVGKDQVDRYIGYGAYQLKRGDFQNALELFDKALELDDKAVLAYANKGTLYSKLGDPNQALIYYNKAIALDPKIEKVHSNKGGILDDLNRYAEAMEAYQTALKIDNKDVHAWNNLGINYVRQKNYVRALACFDSLLKIDPQDTDALINKLNALAWVDKKRATALYHIIKSKFKMQEADVHLVLPGVYFESNQSELADAFFDTEIENGNESFLMLKGLFYYTRDPEKALSIYSEVLSKEPKNPQALDYKMILLMNTDRKTEQEAFIDYVLSFDAMNPNALSFKTQLLLQKKDAEGALKTVKILFKEYNTEQLAIQLMVSVLEAFEMERSLIEIANFKRELDQNAAYQLGYCAGLYLKGIKEYDKAIVVFNEQNALHKFEWNYYQIGIMKNLQGKTEECLAALKITFELSPELKQDAKQYPELENMWRHPVFIELTK